MAAMAADGSAMAASEDGNTNPHSSRANTRNEKKTWILTIKASDGSDGALKSWIKEHCSEAIWQLERGESGYIHWQITITLHRRQRLTWLKNHFCKTAHAEIVRNHDAAFDYTQKQDTRIEGPFYWPEPIRSIPSPLANKELKPWQAEVVRICSTDPDDRTIHWFWETTGNTGKSSLCKHLVLTKGAICVLGKKNDIYHAIDENLKILLVDIPRVCQEFTPYEVIESVKNGMVFSGKYESKMKIFPPPHVFVFANFPPVESRLSEDRWHIVEITN